MSNQHPVTWGWCSQNPHLPCVSDINQSHRCVYEFQWAYSAACQACRLLLITVIIWTFSGILVKCAVWYSVCHCQAINARLSNNHIPLRLFSLKKRGYFGHWQGFFSLFNQIAWPLLGSFEWWGWGETGGWVLRGRRRGSANAAFSIRLIHLACIFLSDPGRWRVGCGGA